MIKKKRVCKIDCIDKHWQMPFIVFWFTSNRFEPGRVSQWSQIFTPSTVLEILLWLLICSKIISFIFTVFCDHSPYIAVFRDIIAICIYPNCMKVYGSGRLKKFYYDAHPLFTKVFCSFGIVKWPVCQHGWILLNIRIRSPTVHRDFRFWTIDLTLSAHPSQLFCSLCLCWFDWMGSEVWNLFIRNLNRFVFSESWFFCLQNSPLLCLPLIFYFYMNNCSDFRRRTMKKH